MNFGPEDDDDGDKLIKAITTNIARDTQTAELLRRAIDVIHRLRMRLEGQKEELRLSRQIIEKQQRILMEKGIIK